MLKKEYGIILKTSHTEADALSMLKSMKTKRYLPDSIFMSNDSNQNLPLLDGTKMAKGKVTQLYKEEKRKLLKITKKGKKIYQYN